MTWHYINSKSNNNKKKNITKTPLQAYISKSDRMTRNKTAF